MKFEKDTLISHYRIVSPIGKGGMGEVYLAEDTKLDRKVALKILPPEFAEDTDRMSRFVREAKSASALNHPNIITIYEINEFENTHFIATEFIDGKTLNDYAKDNPLSYKSVLEIAIQTVSALDVAHSNGIVHRDIKPDNVMIRPDGFVKILDFGIAKLSEKQNPAIESEDATAIQQPSTSPGMIIGTANYMSPEQAKGETVDARTDIFSFGVVLYEMMAGHLPFAGKTPMEIIGAVIHKEPLPLDENVPPEITEIINKCLRKDRNERYQTVKEVLNDLREIKLELDVQDKLEKTVQPNKDDQKTQMLKAVATADEASQTATGETTRKDSITIKK
jgi:serine/threonine protein kinase